MDYEKHELKWELAEKLSFLEIETVKMMYSRPIYHSKSKDEHLILKRHFDEERVDDIVPQIKAFVLFDWHEVAKFKQDLPKRKEALEYLHDLVKKIYYIYLTTSSSRRSCEANASTITR